jgi:hypothetical protein
MKINDRVYGKDAKGKPIEGFVNKILEGGKVEVRSILKSGKIQVYNQSELTIIESNI